MLVSHKFADSETQLFHNIPTGPGVCPHKFDLVTMKYIWGKPAWGQPCAGRRIHRSLPPASCYGREWVFTMAIT